MRKILFVCTGNICRSPMAEGIFNNKIRKVDKSDLFIAISAGVHAMDKQNASQNAVLSLKDMDIDISNHKSQNVSADLMEQSYLVIAMTHDHKNELIKRFPLCSEKIFTFYEFAYDDLTSNVEDPYGMDFNYYKNCANEIMNGMEVILDKI